MSKLSDSRAINIVEAETSDIDRLVPYLEGLFLGNGQGDDPLFSLVVKNQKRSAEEMKNKFLKGSLSTMEEAGWRKLWLAKDNKGDIKGHIDVRQHEVESRSHRVLMGMGVDRSVRKKGVGTQLVHTCIEFCRYQETIDWLDLCVFSDNSPAKSLYLKCGFSVVGEVVDQYRVYGVPVSEVTMAKYVNRA